ncbi:MAG: Mu-like prophage major head subunit gpT family protein [Deltaproteobacteria bacterium]|nr:Mu-like prophage major head subunit gpT family protein [Deltaproteobacteria bacterium]
MTPSNAASLTSYFLGFKSAFQGGFNSAIDPDLWKLFAMEVPSTAREEVYQWLGNHSKMREWLGARIIRKLKAHEYRIKNRKFELTEEVFEDDIEDGQLAELKPRFEDMGEEVALLPNDILFAVLNEGKSVLGYDGVPLFSTSHPVGSGVDSNYETGSAEPWILVDNRRARRRPVIYQPRRAPRFVRKDRPTDDNMFFEGKAIYGADRRDGAGPGFWQTAFLSEDDLDATNFDDALAQMGEVQNDEGRNLGIDPTLLITTKANRAAVNALINVERLANGASNPNYKRVQVVLTDLLDVA